MYELYIVLGYKCNFECKHCVSNSGPSNAISLSKKDLAQIYKSVNQNNSPIDAIHFSGGEPLLYVDTIREIQQNITRNDITYTMTTNGSLLPRNLKSLEEIKLNKIIFSYDKFHHEYISSEKFSDAISSLKDDSIELGINFVFENPEELSLIDDVLENNKNIDLELGSLVKAGRYLNSNEVSQKNDDLISTCPSLRKRKNKKERIIYLPNKGFTPCCSVLSYSNAGKHSEVYTDDFNQYDNNFLKSTLCNSTFKELIEKYNINLKNSLFTSICDVCSELFKHRDVFDSSIVSFLEKNTLPVSFKTNVPADSNLSKLLPNLDISYRFEGKINTFFDEIEEVPEIKISTNDNQISDSLLWSFLETTVYQKHSSNMSKELFMAMQKPFLTFLRESDLKLFFFKNNLLVGLVMGKKIEHGKKPFFHIGFLGYDKSLLSSKEEARYIKSVSLQRLEQCNNSELDFSCRIDSFNTASVTFFKKAGLVQKFINIGKLK